LRFFPAIPLWTFLVQSFVDHGYRKKDLKILNTCRQFLRAVFLSDLASADGKQIELWAWTGQQSCEKQSHLQWPCQPPSLPASYWTLWQQALTTCFVLPHATLRKLRVNIGLWKTDILRRWKWYYSASEERVYSAEGVMWRAYIRLPRRSTRSGTQRFQKDEITWLLPSDATPASIARCHLHRVQLTGLVTGSDPEAIPDVPSATLQEVLFQSKHLDHWAVSTMDCSDDGADLADAIRLGTATAISDGSFQSGIGTSAFILRSNDSSKRITGVNAVPGAEAIQSAYWSELAGISGSLAILQATCLLHDISSGQITIGLDGDQALKTAKP
jgi:hypothetical protein